MEGVLHFFIFMIILPFTMQEKVKEGACSCAVFAVQGIEPIMEHTLRYNVNCDEEGSKKCEGLCIALAERARDNAPATICQKLDIYVENLQVAIYMKSCDIDFWTFTGLQGAEPICCHEGKPTVCDVTISAIENE